MTRLTVVETEEDLMVYIEEQTKQFERALDIGRRICRAYREICEIREEAYLSGDDYTYDKYREAQWELLEATHDIKLQISKMAMHLEYVSNIIL